MKNQSIILGALSLSLVAGLLAWTGYDPDNTYPPTLTTSGTGASRTFTVTAPQLPASSNPSSPTQRYRVFLFTGDGQYRLDEMLADMPNPSWVYAHSYASSGNFTPFVETVDAYDDKQKPPKQLLGSPINIGTGTGNQLPNVNLGIYPVNIIPVRAMVSGHSITYILTYENPTSSACETITGDVVFTFDKEKLEYKNHETYPGSDNVDATNVSNGTIKINLSNLARGTQKNAFLRFKTIGQHQATVTPPTAAMQLTSTDCGISTRPFVLSGHNVVESSHDPNRKTAFIEERNGQQYLIYQITFQNDGPAPVKKVTITDELDAKLKNCVLNNSNFSHHPAGTFSFSVQNGIIEAVINNINLPGTGQLGYGSAFQEPATIGRLRIEIPLGNSCPSTRLPCDAILNRAQIRFDCNPPIETNLAVVNLNCGATFAPDTTCQNTVLSDSTFVLPDDSGTNISLPLLDASTLSFLTTNGFHCQWYPESGLIGANTANAIVTEKRNRTYTLVASKACQRYFIHRTIKVPCALALSESITPGTTSGTYNVALTATGPNAPLVWQDCSTGNTWQMLNLIPGTYYFSVYDPATGCYADKLITLCGQEPNVSDTPGDCVANLQVSGGKPPYTYQWKWNGSSQSFSGHSVSLYGKNNVQVTVTDANGCSTVFSPVMGNCPWWGGVPVWVIIGTVVVAALGVYYFLLKK
ncbi:MAG: PKD domain-containing protein [Saprospiraceae bacterium]|nr:PKD domain-containing protein [Saprospiraceae bacterium]